VYEYIKRNLVRQDRGFQVLGMLLAEEFAQLRERDPQAVTATEFSIHELLRQLAVEREEVRELLGGEKLIQYATRLPKTTAEELLGLAETVSRREQTSIRQAERNADFAFALLDQSKAMLGFLHDKVTEQVTPKNTNTYSAAGAYKNVRPNAALLRGTL
jgi:hypothetical protein